MNPVFSAFRIPISVAVLLLSVIVHEVSHGLMAERLGDPTARRMGRITLNPIPHIDLWGSIIIPAFMLITGGFLIGWAKPVPIDVRYFKDPIRDFAVTALAGPVANMAQVLAYSIVFHVAQTLGWSYVVLYVASTGIFINLLLAIFNLIPIPPLDGSRLVAALLPKEMSIQYLSIERFGFMILLVLLMFGLLRPIFALVGMLHDAIIL
jgi:Zn-dependent protease